MQIPIHNHHRHNNPTTPKPHRKFSGEKYTAAIRNLLVLSLVIFAGYFFFNLFFSSPNYPYLTGKSSYVVAGVRRPLLSIQIKPSEEQQFSAAIAENVNPPKKKIQIQNHHSEEEEEDDREPTSLRHVAFGIAASAKLWSRRKEYIKTWWRGSEMRGAVWLDKVVKSEASLPPIKVSASTSRLRYRNKDGSRSALRISRVVSETLRFINSTKSDREIRWYVMGDDDTVFVAENLIGVLRKYDHRGFYYIGSSSESHLQNIRFSYKMAYGGGGFAISAGLAAELAKMQDRCIDRYPELYGSDDRIHACLAELGVPLTKEPGFHQFDVYGNVFGLLAAHPVAPLVTLHHLDIIKPIFPNTDRLTSIKKLKAPMELDGPALAQQSICYDPARNWTVSVSWGYAVQVFRGTLLPREMEIPGRTFLNWYPRSDYKAHAFNTRPYAKTPCQKPFVYFLTDAKLQPGSNRTLTRYGLNQESRPDCEWKGKTADPSPIHAVEVLKTPDPHMWEKAPRRNCCRLLPTDKKDTLLIDVGMCHAGEFPKL